MSENLIEKYLNDELNSYEAEELIQWVKSDALNNQILAKIKNVWTFTGLNKNIHNISLEKELEIVKLKIQSNDEGLKKMGKVHSIKKLKTPIWKNLLKVAVIFLFIYSIGITYHYFKTGKVEYNEISTKRGEKSQIVLSDGTKIWLNSETKIKYPSNLKTKKVNVYLDGEAYFSVSKNKNRKFIVNTSSINIEVLGTRFNVKSYADENTIETTLEKGQISIKHKLIDKKQTQPIILNQDQKATFIKSSEKLKISTISKLKEKNKNIISDEKNNNKQTAEPKLIISKKIDTELYTSWKDGRLVFKSERLEDFSKKLERWYDVQITIESDELKSWKYTGVFEKETIEQALKALSLSMPFHYEIDQNKIIIKRKTI